MKALGTTIAALIFMSFAINDYHQSIGYNHGDMHIDKDQLELLKEIKELKELIKSK